MIQDAAFFPAGLYSLCLPHWPPATPRPAQHHGPSSLLKPDLSEHTSKRQCCLPRPRQANAETQWICSSAGPWVWTHPQHSTEVLSEVGGGCMVDFESREDGVYLNFAIPRPSHMCSPLISMSRFPHQSMQQTPMMGGINHMSAQGVPSGIRPNQLLPDQQQQQQQYLRQQQQQQMLRVSWRETASVPGPLCGLVGFFLTLLFIYLLRKNVYAASLGTCPKWLTK